MSYWIIFRSAYPELFSSCDNKTIKYWYLASCPSTRDEYIDINAEIACWYCKKRWPSFTTRFDCEKKCNY